ncbi:MAG TPA: hypothetical protein VHE13_07835 [Opitutus sp.]|nr:hypothetical protein [Opitutus sp.]
MRRALLAIFLVLSCSLHASWRDLRPGFNASKTIAAIGRPLLVNRSRGYETWTYDRGGYVEFEGGRLVYWEASKPPAAAAVAQR